MAPRVGGVAGLVAMLAVVGKPRDEPLDEEVKILEDGLEDSQGWGCGRRVEGKERFNLTLHHHQGWGMCGKRARALSHAIRAV
jgi:hypothetical protein